MVWTMSIALERNNSDSIQRPKFMQCVSVYESPETKGLTGDRRFPVRLERKSEEDSSSSSSIGKNSDDSGGSSDGEDSNEAQSSYKGPLDTLDALDEVLPIKRGISNFYNGKSKSFTSLGDASTASSIKDLVKLENPYTRKRKNLLAHNNFFDKNQNYHFKSNGNGTQKRATNSNRSALVGVTMKSSEFIHSEDSNSISSSHSNHLPPLHPQCKRSPGNGTSLPPPQRNAPWRSFSFSDLQCVAAASPNITGLAIRGGDVDNKYY